MPTFRSPCLRTARACSTAARRPRVLGSDASVTVHPSWPAGQSPIFPLPPPEGASREPAGAVANPPVAVTSVDVPPVPPLATTARAAPATATRRPSRLRRIQPCPGSRVTPTASGPGSRSPHSTQYSWPWTSSSPQRGHVLIDQPWLL